MSAGLEIIVRPILNADTATALPVAAADAGGEPADEGGEGGCADASADMGDEELEALMTELEREAVNDMSPEEEVTLKLECYKAMIAGLIEAEAYTDVLRILDYYESILCEDDLLADECTEYLHQVRSEYLRAAEIAGMRAGDMVLNFRTRLDSAEEEEEEEEGEGDGPLTVRQLKDRIEEQRHIPVNHQRLVFAGTELENAQTLSHCRIANGAVLYLVLRRPRSLRLAVHIVQTEKSFVLDKVCSDDTVLQVKINVPEFV